MRGFRRFIKSAVCFALTASLMGCSSSRELNELGIVMGVGIDRGDDAGTVKITAQVVKASKINSSEKIGAIDKAYVNFSSTDSTVFSAVRDMTNEVSRKLYFPDNQIIIIGSDAAQDGVRKYLDFFMRDLETRLSVLMLVSRGPAQSLLSVNCSMEELPSYNIAKLIENSYKYTSETPIVRLSDFKESLLSKTASGYMPIAEITGDGEQKTVKICGTAVFRGDVMAGELDNTETRGMLWVLGEVKSGIINCKSSKGNAVSMEIVEARGKVTPEITGGKVKIKIAVYEEGNIGEQAGTEDLSGLLEVSYLEKQKAEVIKGEVLSAIKKAQALDADVFGFGDAIYKKYPKEWASMEDNWGSIFKNLEVQVTVEAKLRNMGRILPPAVPRQVG